MSRDRWADRLLCTRCAGLRCVGEPPDRCSCHEPLEHATVAEMERGLPCRMCASCLLDVAVGHTRWLRHHCDACVPWVRGLNDAAGQMLVPLGIHTLVNGIALAGDAARHREPRFRWQQQFDVSSRSIAWLSAYRATAIRKRLVAVGLENRPLVSLDEYLEACSIHGFSVGDGWAQLMGAVVAVS